MNKPKSITQLSKEQLEDLCLNLMHTDKVKTEMINQLETSIATKDSELLQLKEELRQLKTNRDETIELLKDKNLKVVNVAPNVPLLCNKELISILERGKE